MKTKNLFCALALTVTAILFAPPPVAASVTDLLEMSEKIDQADKQDLLTLLDKANGCTRARNFSCSEEQLRKAAKLANGSKDKLALNTATQNLQAEQQRVKEEIAAKAEQERQIRLADERRAEELRAQARRAEEREEEQEEKRRRRAQRERDDDTPTKSAAESFLEGMQESYNESANLRKTHNDLEQNLNRIAQEKRAQEIAERRENERAAENRRADERATQRANQRAADDQRVAANQRAQENERIRQQNQERQQQEQERERKRAEAETVKLAEQKSRSQAEEKEVIGEGKTGGCYSREQAIHLAELDARADAHKECEALGSGWRYDRDGFSGYVGCTPCTGGESENFKCNITKAKYYCKKPPA